ncbi:hypothetical protein HAX54_027588 [Datura stramonium]|uniref:Uncharacterized protein n=1 Tax=Datura stramonium TaxID=4076 RepID=A0ABS8V2Q4_DATST|nr:hypothetical protein [Datura stramonium]
MGNIAIGTSTQASDEALSSSSAPPIAPRPIQTLSASRMVQFSNMKARNNTKLTSLIKYMPEMINRTIDKALAPLQLDLSIFDAPLLEDDGRPESKGVDEDRDVYVATQRSMDDLTVELMGAGPSSHTSQAKDVATTTTVPTVTTQSEEVGQKQEDHST